MALTKLNLSAASSGTLPSSSAPIGSVIQTVKYDPINYTSGNAANSRSFVDIPNLSVSITPIFQNSNFLILVNTPHRRQYAGAYTYMTIKRSTASGGDVDATGTLAYTNTTQSGAHMHYDHDSITQHQALMTVMDTPNTTETITYTPQVRTNNGFVTLRWNNFYVYLQVQEIKQ